MISTHTPLAGRDHVLQIPDTRKNRFLLTRPLRDVTDKPFLEEMAKKRISTHTPLAGRDSPGRFTSGTSSHISTHTPLAGRDDIIINNYSDNRISTHTPLAGRDPNYWDLFCVISISTHTPLAGRDLPGVVVPYNTDGISTHTPLAGRDCSANKEAQGVCNFYSHAPCGT